MAESHYQMGDFEAALTECTNALALMPILPGARLLFPKILGSRKGAGLEAELQSMQLETDEPVSIAGAPAELGVESGVESLEERVDG